MYTDYRPINCDFHDHLLDRATRRASVRVTYSTKDGKVTKESVIKDVYTKKGEEFMLLSTGNVIRLDHLIEVDGIPLPKDASCQT